MAWGDERGGGRGWGNGRREHRVVRVKCCNNENVAGDKRVSFDFSMYFWSQ